MWEGNSRVFAAVEHGGLVYTLKQDKYFDELLKIRCIWLAVAQLGKRPFFELQCNCRQLFEYRGDLFAAGRRLWRVAANTDAGGEAGAEKRPDPFSLVEVCCGPLPAGDLVVAVDRSSNFPPAGRRWADWHGGEQPTLVVARRAAIDATCVELLRLGALVERPFRRPEFEVLARAGLPGRELATGVAVDAAGQVWLPLGTGSRGPFKQWAVEVFGPDFGRRARLPCSRHPAVFGWPGGRVAAGSARTVYPGADPEDFELRFVELPGC